MFSKIGLEGQSGSQILSYYAKATVRYDYNTKDRYHRDNLFLQEFTIK